jgi:hypothetical protein
MRLAPYALRITVLHNATCLQHMSNTEYCLSKSMPKVHEMDGACWTAQQGQWLLWQIRGHDMIQ